MRVLAGAAQTLPKVGAMEVELSVVPLYDGQVLYREMIDHLDGLGFDLGWVEPGFADPRSGQLLQMDGIFVRRGEDPGA